MASENGTYTVFFSGRSQLPEPLGRQFVVVDINVGMEEVFSGHFKMMGTINGGTIGEFVCLWDTVTDGIFTVKLLPNGQGVVSVDAEKTETTQDIMHCANAKAHYTFNSQAIVVDDLSIYGTATLPDGRAAMSFLLNRVNNDLLIGKIEMKVHITSVGGGFYKEDSFGTLSLTRRE